MRTRSIAVLATGSLLAALPAPLARADHRPGHYETTKGRSQPIYEDSTQQEFRVRTRYGRIYGVVRRPVVPRGVKVPVILTYTPYNIISPDRQVELDDELTRYFVPRGYARAVFDLVGTRESGGCYDYGGIRERKTGAAVVDFLGSRSWSNGKVGMIGGSYEGTTAWAAAVESPRHLTTIVPQVAIGRWYDYAYGQGVRFFSGFGTPWLFDFGFGFLPPTNPGDPLAWAEALQDRVRPCERVEHNDRAFLPDPIYDQFWDERDYLRRIDRVKASVMIEGSWADTNVHPINSIEMWHGLPARYPKKLVMGQQGHNDANLVDSIDIRHAWFDYWLRGLDTGVMRLPRVDSELNTRLRLQDPTWPPRNSKRVRFRLRKRGHKRRVLRLQEERAVWQDVNPELDEDEVLAGRGGEAAILFVGRPVRRDVRLSGTPRLVARVKTNEQETYLTPVVFDQSPTGSRQVVARGLLNSRNRNSLRKSTLVKPGTPWKARVRFQPVDWELERGHRLGIAIMSMNSDEALYADETRATNRLLLRRGRARLILRRSRI